MPSFALDSARRACARVLTLVSGVTLLASAAIALAEEPPLSFSNRHLDMSSDQLEATHAVAVPSAESAAGGEAPLVLTLPSQAPAPVTGAVSNQPVWDSEFVDSASAAVPSAATASAVAPATANGAGVASFAQCMEGAIRGGAGYDESGRVCRALFPGQG